jgi:site-specific DNA-adenine methylase
VTFEVRDYREIDYENAVVYCDPPYFGASDRYTKPPFSHEEYVKFLYQLKQNPSITLIHSNSASFREIYKTDEQIEEIKLYNRANSKNPGSQRTELLYN